MKQEPKIVEIYSDLLEIRAIKGKNSMFAGERYKHPFKRGARVVGVVKGGMFKLRAGDLIVRSRQGKRLWKMFQYDERDLS